MTQELVEDQRLAARAQYPGDLAEACGGVPNDRQDQVQHCDIESFCGKGEILCVSLNRGEIDTAGSRDGAAQHGMREVEADIVMAGRKVRQIEAGADTGQQDPARRLWQRRQAVLAHGLRGPRNCGIVEGRDQRIAVLQTQCKTRGMASTNSGISASKRVPSSPTIW